MPKSKFFERLLYITAILLIVLTLISIVCDRKALSSYYAEKHASSFVVERGTEVLKSSLSGKGTEAKPYLIKTEEDFEAIRLCIKRGFSCEGVYFLQANDIELSGETWVPLSIPYDNVGFCGTYNGNGHKITNLNLADKNTSLFGLLGGTVKNLSIEGSPFSAESCAGFANKVAEDTNPVIINCIFTDLNEKNQKIRYCASFVNKFAGGNLINCWSDSVYPMVNTESDDPITLYNCRSKYKLLANDRIFTQQENSVAFCDYSEEVIDDWNDSVDGLYRYNIAGDYNALGISAENTLFFREDKINVASPDDVANFYKFFRNLLLYIVLFAADIFICQKAAARFHWNLRKCIVYSLLTLCTLMTFGIAFLSRGESFIALLYDGRTDGRLKVFTDFFDCIRPGFDPYHQTESGISTIYPPLVTLLFAILGHFVPQWELYSSITARDSQMGSLLFVYCLIGIAILICHLIKKYKQGKRYEVRYFTLLLFLTYPMIYCIERGNIVILCAICIILFLYNYRSEHYAAKVLAWVALSVAAGIKIYPAVLGLLLLREKRWKDTCHCLCFGIILNLIPALFFKTGLASVAYMVINAQSMVSNNSVIGAKVDLAHMINIPRELLDISFFNALADGYSVIRCILLLLSIVVILFSKLENWKIYTLLLLDIIVLTSFSPFYYILYLTAPLMMFLDTKEKRGKLDNLYALCFVGVFMTFASSHKYPFIALAPTQAIWNMTVISGGFTLLFLIVLLVDGSRDIIKHSKNILGSRS